MEEEKEKRAEKSGNRTEYINTFVWDAVEEKNVEKECITVDCLLNSVGKLNSNISYMHIFIHNKSHLKKR